jgi:hypothetical protein
VLGVEDHRDVEGLDDLRLRDLPEDHVEEVLAEGQRGVGRDRLEPLRQPVGRRDRGRDLGQQPHRLAPLRGVETSAASGSSIPMKETAVRIASIGCASFGNSAQHAQQRGLSARFAFSSAWKAASCAAVGSSPFHSR